MASSGERRGEGAQGRITAVLGPTNTGKTHMAVERMLGHRSGMIGFPLRLLAREIYDRVVALRGERAVALITGEERRLPPNPAYFVCTAEAMPLDRRVAFLAIDEVQLAADWERGHVFTDRLLRARGTEETMFLGAETIRPLIRSLVPTAEFVIRPRFSRLTYAGVRKLTRLPPRSAVVAFSAADVYALAEVIRRQRGGTAVVLGALSPRTRNAQVAMYQAGEVDYLVATDAIGMGLNMNVSHVAFSSLRKFDGRHARALGAAEVAQIAGRAGRHTSDGTFGATWEAGELPPPIVEAVENHQFERLRTIWWRNADLDLGGLDALIRSLDRRAPHPVLRVKRDADDRLALEALARDGEIKARVASREALRLLWEVCQIPDFRKVMAEAHARLLSQIFRHLTQAEGRLPTDWVARMVARLDRTEGDIDTLVGRIAHVRTWTYVAHRAEWLVDAGHWQERTRGIEDRLSDALHERLTQRFVDRRATAVVQARRDRRDLATGVEDDHRVTVEGAVVGRIEGFRFLPDPSLDGGDRRLLVAAAERALQGEIEYRLQQLEVAPPLAITPRADGVLLWQEAAVGRLRRGALMLAPEIEPVRGTLLGAAGEARLAAGLRAWLEEYLTAHLAPLRRLAAADLAPGASGIAYQVVEGLGSVARHRVEDQVRTLGAGERQALARLGIRLGLVNVFLPALLRPAAMAARALLWRVHSGSGMGPGAPAAGQIALPVTADAPAGFHAAIGYAVLGPRVLRHDMVERLAAICRQRARGGAFVPAPDLLALAGCRRGELRAVLGALGFHATADVDGKPRFAPAPRPRQAAVARQGSPFAVLGGVRFGR